MKGVLTLCFLPGCGNKHKSKLVYVHKFQGNICALCPISPFFKIFVTKRLKKGM